MSDQKYCCLFFDEHKPEGRRTRADNLHLSLGDR